jgi:hypothetical protein
LPAHHERRFGEPRLVRLPRVVTLGAQPQSLGHAAQRRHEAVRVVGRVAAVAQKEHVLIVAEAAVCAKAAVGERQMSPATPLHLIVLLVGVTLLLVYGHVPATAQLRCQRCIIALVHGHPLTLRSNGLEVTAQEARGANAEE